MSLYNLEAIKITLPAAFQSIAWRGGQDSTYFVFLRQSIIIAKTKSMNGDQGTVRNNAFSNVPKKNHHS